MPGETNAEAGRMAIPPKNPMPAYISCGRPPASAGNTCGFHPKGCPACLPGQKPTCHIPFPLSHPVPLQAVPVIFAGVPLPPRCCPRKVLPSVSGCLQCLLSVLQLFSGSHITIVLLY